MFQVYKNEPDFFIEAKRRVANPNISSAWSDENINNIRKNLRDHLSQEQKNICIFCEKLLKEEKSHIDHFEKRSFAPQKTLDYNNFFVSCNNEKTCAKHKDKRIAKIDYIKFINPVLENPEEYFEYMTTGEIILKNGLSQNEIEKAKFTIEILNLNNKALVEERKTAILQILSMIKYIENRDDLNYFENFFTLKNWIFANKTILGGIE